MKVLLTLCFLLLSAGAFGVGFDPFWPLPPEPPTPTTGTATIPLAEFPPDGWLRPAHVTVDTSGGLKATALYVNDLLTTSVFIEEVMISTDMFADFGQFDELVATTATVGALTADTLDVTTATVDALIADAIDAVMATIDALIADTLDVATVTATYGEFASLSTDNLEVDGNGVVDGDLQVTGDLDVDTDGNIDGSLVVDGAVAVGGDLLVTGDITTNITLRASQTTHYFGTVTVGGYSSPYTIKLWSGSPNNGSISYTATEQTDIYIFTGLTGSCVGYEMDEFEYRIRNAYAGSQSAYITLTSSEASNSPLRIYGTYYGVTP